MMESILSFSLKSSICSAVFFLYYLLALKNVRIYRFNRAYLLASAALSLLLPFVGLEMFQIKTVNLPAFPLLEISGKGSTEMLSTMGTANSFPWSEILAGCYFTVAFLILSGLIIKS